jgi:hypothetical protein
MLEKLHVQVNILQLLQIIVTVGKEEERAIESDTTKFNTDEGR